MRRRSATTESADAIAWEAEHEQALHGEHRAQGENPGPFQTGKLDLDVAEREEDSYQGD